METPRTVKVRGVASLVPGTELNRRHVDFQCTS